MSYSLGDVSKIFYSTSTHNGATWSAPTVVAEATCTNNDINTDNDCPIVDKPWIAVRGSNVYLCWVRLDDMIRVFNSKPNYLSSTMHLFFKRVDGSTVELDSGTTTLVNNGISDRSVQGCNIAVNNSNGIIYVAWTKLVSDTSAT